MARCKDCIHYAVCEARITADENFSEWKYTEDNNCDNFKDRNKFVELPCVAIVEQFLGSDGKFDKRRTDHNGRIAVVYINRHKYAVPSIDLTSQRYNTAKAYERLEELKREEVEQILRSD
ncbi:MAG: hypothetical protein ACI4RM_01320 [Ruminococcus sp.]